MRIQEKINSRLSGYAGGKKALPFIINGNEELVEISRDEVLKYAIAGNNVYFCKAIKPPKVETRRLDFFKKRGFEYIMEITKRWLHDVDLHCDHCNEAIVYSLNSKGELVDAGANIGNDGLIYCQDCSHNLAIKKVDGWL